MNHFSFTKLLVDDLEKTASFYKAVCGLTETARVEDAIGGRPISEILFAATATGGSTFVLLKYLDQTKPPADEVILGFVTDDVDAFVARATENGGRVVEAAVARPQHGVKVAFVTDCEGHLIEVVEMLAA